MSNEYKKAALMFFAAITEDNKEHIAFARINLFKEAMKEANAEENDTQTDLEQLREELHISENAPILKAYKMFIAGFNAGLNAMTALLEAQ